MKLFILFMVFLVSIYSFAGEDTPNQTVEKKEQAQPLEPQEIPENMKASTCVPRRSEKNGEIIDYICDTPVSKKKFENLGKLKPKHIKVKTKKNVNSSEDKK